MIGSGILAWVNVEKMIRMQKMVGKIHVEVDLDFLSFIK